MDVDTNFDFSQLKKKKKKKKKKEDCSFKEKSGEDIKEDDTIDDDEDFSHLQKKKNVDYEADELEREEEYKKLLSNVYQKLTEANKNVESEKKKRLPGIQLRHIRGKKTEWVNFIEILNLLDRSYEGLIKFLTAETGSHVQMIGESCRINKFYQRTHIEFYLKGYIKKFVLCNTCKSFDTFNEKRDRMIFIICRKCNSSRSSK